MVAVYNYLFKGNEYMVVDGSELMLTGDAIRLLANRRQGAGADRVLVRTDGLLAAYEADGTESAIEADDLAVLALKKCDYEIHLTSYFVSRLQVAGERKLRVA